MEYRRDAHLAQPSCRARIRQLPKSWLRFSLSSVSVEQIKQAIDQLSFEERAELAAWLHGWKSDEWDEQMKRDIASGKLDAVLREVDDDARAGQLRDMP
ncbi:MAG: hypothetical protein ABIU29_05670 [Chthoniobacterales bacterium]